MIRKPRVAIGLAVVCLTVAACSGDASTSDGALLESTSTSAPQTTATTAPQATSTTGPAPDAGADPERGPESFPVTLDTAAGPLTLEERPGSIVSLSPTATEMLFAIGAGPQVVAVDEFSTYPTDAPVTDLSGYTPNVEAILSFDPDLVVVANDLDSVVGSLEAVGVPVLLQPAVETIEGIADQLLQLGVATGNEEGASASADAMAARLDEILAGVPPVDEPLTYFHELDPSLYTVTSDTFIGSVYELVGLSNIADPADEDGFGYPQLSEEFVIEADPDLIFLADGERPDSVAARPGWTSLSAVTDGAVFEVDADIASRWSPRIVEFLDQVVGVMASYVEQR